jgi:hypothetical protein
MCCASKGNVDVPNHVSVKLATVDDNVLDREQGRGMTTRGVVEIQTIRLSLETRGLVIQAATIRHLNILYGSRVAGACRRDLDTSVASVASSE